MNLQLLLVDCGEHIKQIHTKQALFRRHRRIQFENCIWLAECYFYPQWHSNNMAPVVVLLMSLKLRYSLNKTNPTTAASLI